MRTFEALVEARRCSAAESPCADDIERLITKVVNCKDKGRLLCFQDGAPGGDRAGLEGLGVVGVGAPGMPPAAAREPTAVVLQRKTSGLRTGAASTATASHDLSSALAAEAASVNQARGLPHHDTPVRRRPRVGDTAAERDSSDLGLAHHRAELGDPTSLGDSYDANSIYSSGAGPQAFQLKWPLQPQPVNSAHSHLSSAAAKISAAADRYSNAVGTGRAPVSQSRAASELSTDTYSNPAGTSKAAGMQPQAAAGIPAEGRRSSLSRRSTQSSAHSSTHSSDVSASVHFDPFTSRPLLAADVMVSPVHRQHMCDLHIL